MQAYCTHTPQPRIRVKPLSCSECTFLPHLDGREVGHDDGHPSRMRKVSAQDPHAPGWLYLTTLVACNIVAMSFALIIILAIFVTAIVHDGPI